MKNSLVCVIFLAFLPACGSGGGSNDAPPAAPSVNISGSAQTRDIVQSGIFTVNISGSDHVLRVTGSSHVGTLNVSGSNSVLTFTPGSTVEQVNLGGVDNTIHLPAGLTPAISTSGSGNRVVYDSTSG